MTYPVSGSTSQLQRRCKVVQELSRPGLPYVASLIPDWGTYNFQGRSEMRDFLYTRELSFDNLSIDDLELECKYRKIEYEGCDREVLIGKITEDKNSPKWEWEQDWDDAEMMSQLCHQVPRTKLAGKSRMTYPVSGSTSQLQRRCKV